VASPGNGAMMMIVILDVNSLMMVVIYPW